MTSDRHLALMNLMNEVEAPSRTYRNCVRRAASTETDSPQNLAAIERGHAALDDIEQAVRLWVAAHPDAGEVDRLHVERRRYRIAWRMARTRALATGGAADRYAARAREGQSAMQDMLGALLGAQMERDELQAEVAALRAVLAKQ